MNWEAIGAVGEVAGAIGVIVTLAFLATQIRQNTTVAKATTRRTLADGMQRLGSYADENDEIA